MPEEKIEKEVPEEKDPVEITDTTDVRTLTSEQLSELGKPQDEGVEPEEKEPKKRKPPAKKADEQPPKEVKEELEVKPDKKTPEQIKADHDALQAEHTKLKERWANQEKLLQRFGNEVGIMRKMSPEVVQERLQKIRDMYNPDSEIFDPVQGNEEIQRLRSDQTRETQQEEITRTVRKVSETREAIKQFAPDFETEIDGMANLIKEDGAGEEYVQAFRQNPYLLDHTTLYNMHKRVALSKENVTLKAEVEKLKTENETLKRKPDEMLRRIENAGKFKPESAASKGASSQAAGLYDKLPAHMTREELNAAAEKAAQTGG